MIAISIQRPGDGKVDATTKTSVANGFLAVTNIVFAYGRSLLPVLPYAVVLTITIYSWSRRLLWFHLGDANTHRLPEDSIPAPRN